MLTDGELVELSNGTCKVNWGCPKENPVPFEAEKAAGIEHVNGVVPPTPEYHTAEARKCLPLLECKGDERDPDSGKTMVCSVSEAAAGHSIEYLWVQDTQGNVIGRTQKLNPSSAPMLKFECARRALRSICKHFPFSSLFPFLLTQPLSRLSRLAPARRLPKGVKTVFAFSKSSVGVWRSQAHFKMAMPGQTEFFWGPESQSLDLRWTVPNGYNHTFDVVEGYIPKPEGWVHPAVSNEPLDVSKTIQGAA